MARVNVDSIAFSDARFTALAGLMGYDDPDAALGKMIRVWNQCYERETPYLSKLIVTSIFKSPDAPNWLIMSELGEETPEGTIRIKGATGRIEWVTEKRRNGKKYGKLGAPHGLKGGRPRKTPSPGFSEPVQNRVENPPPAPAPAPAPDLNTPHTPQRGAIGFDEFWKQYPSKVAKAKAKASWEKLKPSPELLKDILEAIDRQKGWRQWVEGYIPHPATWINGRRWEDEPPSEPSRNGNGLSHKKTTAEIVAETVSRLRAAKETNDDGP